MCFSGGGGCGCGWEFNLMEEDRRITHRNTTRWESIKAAQLYCAGLFTNTHTHTKKNRDYTSLSENFIIAMVVGMWGAFLAF